MGAWTLACYLTWMPGALVTLPTARANQWWNDRLHRLWARGLVGLMGVRVEVSGLPPGKPFFLVANHLSYLDILVLGSRLGSTFVSKHELAHWPVLGHLARITGTIFVNRTRKRDALRVLEEIDRAIARGAGVVLFPEGTSSAGDRIYPLKSALLEWAARREFPVHAAVLSYRTDPPDPDAVAAVCWWGDATFTPHFLQFLTLRRVHARITFPDRPVIERDRSRLSGQLHELLERHFTPIDRAPGREA